MMKPLAMAMMALVLTGTGASEPNPIDRLATKEGVSLGMSQSQAIIAMSGTIEHFDSLSGLGGQFLMVSNHFDTNYGPVEITYRTENWPVNLEKPDLRVSSNWIAFEQRRPYSPDLVVTTIHSAQLCLNGIDVVKVGEMPHLPQDWITGARAGVSYNQMFWETEYSTLWVTCSDSGVVEDITYVSRLPQAHGQLSSESSRASEINHK